MHRAVALTRAAHAIVGRERMGTDRYLPSAFGFVMASKSVAEENEPVGFMFRDKPDRSIPLSLDKSTVRWFDRFP